MAAQIIEGRKLYVSDGSTCEPWEVEIPNMLEDNRGRLRHPAAAGVPSVNIDFERQGNDLMLEVPCFGDKKGFCTVCDLLTKPDGALLAFARQDACEERKPDTAAALRGCVAAVASSTRDQIKRAVDGSLRDEFIARVAASRTVSIGAGADCIAYHVRKQGKRLFLDWELSEYPLEVTAGQSGAVAVDEVAEPNPRYKPRGPGAIGIGCCDTNSYHVFALGEGTATLRRAPVAKGELAKTVEFRMTSCPR